MDKSRHTRKSSFRLSPADLARLDVIAADLGVSGRTEAIRRLAEEAAEKIRKKREKKA